MNITKLFSSGMLGFVSLVLIKSIPVYAQPIQSVASTYNSTYDIQIHFQHPRATSDVADNGKPEAEGTGTRGGNQYLTTQIPLTVITGQSSSLSLTASSHPTFFVYVPYTSTEVSYGVFSLYDQQTKQEVWNVVFQLPQHPGIVSIPTPQHEKPLEVGKNYRWFFELNCVNNNITYQEPMMVRGKVKRVSSEGLEAELSIATPLEKVAIYAKQGLWYDAIGQLATLQQSYPQNSQLKTLWVELLKASNHEQLKPIYQESLVGDITLNL
ncbi:DUF928 domain-containing protein [Lyngbya aestuarii]|nr:DUF928 domain-containing protein [Lyngbya aestuarii]